MDVVDETPSSDIAHVLERALFAQSVLSVVGRVELHAYNEVVGNDARCSDGVDDVAEEV